MDKVGQIRDALKSRYSKPCCVKVSVGVAVGVAVVVVVVVVAAVVAGGGGGGTGGDGGGNAGGGSGNIVNDDIKGANAVAPAVQWRQQFSVRLESGFSQILAIDDVKSRYLIEINSSNDYVIYIVVDFLNKRHVYVIVDKGPLSSAASPGTVGKSVLSCESSSFERSFTGGFTSSADLLAGGANYQQAGRGPAIRVSAERLDGPYSVPNILLPVLNDSCAALSSADDVFTWDTKKSVCGDNTTLKWDVPCNKSTNHCPLLPTTSLTAEQACLSFRQCNHLMARCHSQLSQDDHGDSQPFCLCRRNIVADLDNIRCSSNDEGGGEVGGCAAFQKEVRSFESSAPCYCGYNVTRIYPVLQQQQQKQPPQQVEPEKAGLGWEIGAYVFTAPARQFSRCPC